MYKLVSPSLYYPDYCEGLPALLFAPVDLGSVVGPPAASDSSDHEERHPDNIQVRPISSWVISYCLKVLYDNVSLSFFSLVVDFPALFPVAV